MKTFRKRNKLMAMIILLSLSIQTLFPLQLFSVNGPEQPEFSGFEPIGNEELVNLFTGDFQYSIPILTVPGKDGLGYSINLGYSSAVKPDDEASWVGYGWTLNAGSITRNVNGFPDDFLKTPVKYWNKVEPNITYSITPSIGMELFAKKPESLGLGSSLTLRYNNKRGWAALQRSNLSGGYDIEGVVDFGVNIEHKSSTGFTGGFTIGLGSRSVGYVNPFYLLTKNDFYDLHGSKLKSQRIQYNPDKSFIRAKDNATSIIMNAISSPPSQPFPTVLSEYTGVNINLAVSAKIDFIPQVGTDIGLEGSYTKTAPTDYLKPKTELVSGYMYSDNV